MNNPLENQNVKRVNEFIKKFNSSLKVVLLNQSAKTAIDAAKALDCEIGAIVKSLIIKSEEGFLLCLMAGDKKCSFKKLKIILDKKNLSMAKAEEVKLHTGFSIGGVSPVGHIKKLPTFIDESLNRFNNIFGAAGHPNCIFKINYKELIKITNGLVVEIAE
mgnify:CR=1 FL=1